MDIGIADTFLGFKALPLRYSKDSTSYHYLYVKEHSIRGQTDDKPKGRTLFVMNVPPYASEENIRHALSKAGEISNVTFSQKPCSGNATILDEADTKLFGISKPIIGFKVAYVVFKSVLGLQKCLALKQLDPLINANVSAEVGLIKWIRQYNNSIVDESIMQTEIDNFMQVFDEDENKRIQHDKSLREADDEGWVTVTKRGRKPGFSRKESVEHKIIQKENAGKKRKELLNFYTFQIRESKMKHLVNLRRKFEEDKKKIALLKQSRKFKPF